MTFYNNYAKVLVLRVRKENLKNREKIMTENEAVEYVKNNARYYRDDSDEPYAVYYDGEPFWGESPRDLVEQILDFVNG